MLLADLRQDAAAVLTNCEKHLRINPHDLTSYCRRGLTRLLQCQPEEDVRPDFDRVLRLRPDVKSQLELLIDEAKQRRIH